MDHPPFSLEIDVEDDEDDEEELQREKEVSGNSKICILWK